MKNTNIFWKNSKDIKEAKNILFKLEKNPPKEILILNITIFPETKAKNLECKLKWRQAKGQWKYDESTGFKGYLDL